MQQTSLQSNLQRVQHFSAKFSQVSSQKRILDKRFSRRYRHADVARCYCTDHVGVRLTTVDRRYGAQLVDLITTGVSVLTHTLLKIGMPVGIEIQVGEYIIEGFGQVRNVSMRNNIPRAGIQFLHLGSAERAFLDYLDQRYMS